MMSSFFKIPYSDMVEKKEEEIVQVSPLPDDTECKDHTLQWEIISSALLWDDYFYPKEFS
jgi:hypothetical protein